MIALTRILVATDFSDSSAAALKYGLALARMFGARLHVLHAAGRHDLQLMVERQRVIDVFLQDPTSPDVHHNAARELLGELLTAEEAEAARAAGEAYRPKDFDDLDELNEMLDVEYIDELERRQEERERRRRDAGHVPPQELAGGAP